MDIFISYAIIFFLSGCTFSIKKYKDINQFIERKFITLIIPYFVFAILIFLFEIVKCIYFNEINIIFKKFLGIIIQNRLTEYTIGLWFIPCLFVAEILLYIIIKIFNDNHNKILAIVSMLGILGYTWCVYVGISITWSIDTACIAIGFIYLGYLYKFYIKENKILNKYSLLVLIFINILFCYLNYLIYGYRIDMYANQYGNIIFFYISAISGILVILNVSKILRTNKWIIFLGQNSLVYYAFHASIVYFILNKVFSFIPFYRVNKFWYLFVDGIVITILTFMILTPIVNLYNKRIRSKFILKLNDNKN